MNCSVRKCEFSARFAIGIVLSITVLLSQSSYATVLEYGTSGDLTVTETQIPKPENYKLPSDVSKNEKSQLREIVREVAASYSGTLGVRLAGLDAITFVEVFEALIERESAFNHLAVSEKGAKGLGQLMPNTASDLGVTDAFDPKQNLIGSAKYLTQLLEQFGSLELALAAYNAGPERVKKYNGVPPYAETRSYISWIYKKIGREPSPKTTLAESDAVATSDPIAKQPTLQNHDQPLKGDVSVWEF